jgi:hypothetical protein
MALSPAAAANRRVGLLVKPEITPPQILHQPWDGTVGLHRSWLEGNAQRLAMKAMFVKIHQHQPAWEHAVEKEAPAIGRGEVSFAVEQHEFVRLRPQHCNAADPK